MLLWLTPVVLPARETAVAGVDDEKWLTADDCELLDVLITDEEAGVLSRTVITFFSW